MPNNISSAVQAALCMCSLHMNRFNKLNNLSRNSPGYASPYILPAAEPSHHFIRERRTMFLFAFPSAQSAANDRLLVLVKIIRDHHDCDLSLGQIIQSLAILTPLRNSDRERNPDLENNQKRGQSGSNKFSLGLRVRIKSEEEEAVRAHMKRRGSHRATHP